MSQGFVCDFIVAFSNLVQGFFSLLYLFLGFFGVPTPLVDAPTGSIIGCNL